MPASLSSDGIVTVSSAIYSYHFGGSFRCSTKELLISTFDAALWEDNMGKQLHSLSPNPAIR